MTVHIGVTAGAPRTRPVLLDVAAEVLVADPSASLGDVAEAAGISRTTLHKHYATRDDLLLAVGRRALDLWDAAVDTVDPDGPDGGLHALAGAIIPIGPQLAFLWRTPSFDHLPEISGRWAEVEARAVAVLQRSQHLGVIRSDVPTWWMTQLFHSLSYVAAGSVRSGHLAPRDAADRMIGTLLYGIGDPPPHRGAPA